MAEKTAAGLTAAAALCGGMLPAVPEGLQLLAPALTASAASVTTAIAPGVVYRSGDSIDFGSGCYIQTDDFDEGEVEKVSGSMKLSYAQFSDTYNQYEFKLDGMVTLWLCSEKLGEPAGVKVKSGAGTLSNPITFEIVFMVPTAITSDPADASGYVGDTVQFTVAATGEELSYQWQYYNPKTDTWADTTLTGAKTATLSVGATTGRNGLSYRCIITDANGKTLTSDAALLTVQS